VKRRIAVSLAIGCAYGLLTYWLLVIRDPATQASDFTYPWLAARAVAHGVDPYRYVRMYPTPHEHALFYPMPAAFDALPFAWLPVQIAGAAFVGVGCALLAFAITKRDVWRLMIFATAAAFQAAWSVQWTPLLMASALSPAALGLIVAKPNLALPLLAYQTNRRAILYAIIGGGVLLAVSLALDPRWPLHWYQTIHYEPIASQYRVPMLTRWGLVLSLAAFRWRTRDGRLVLAMACVPQNFFFYDQLPLFLVARTRLQLLFMVIVSWLARLIPIFHPMGAVDNAELSVKYIPLMMLGAYLPALVCVLERPNVESAGEN
jgi:hypothetical protein